MAEGGDWDPGEWKGHDFGSSAAATYDAYAGRSYKAAVAAKKTVKDLVPQSIETLSKRPLVLVTDITGSMCKWPSVMFGKMPYLDTEGREYLGKEAEFCLAAIGDANPDRSGGSPDDYPLQVRPFAKGVELRDRLKELVIEGDGGGQFCETYELAALYFARQVRMPNAVSPVLIFIGDEAPYDEIPISTAEECAHVTLKKPLKTKDVFKELMEKYSVYVILKPYGKDVEDVQESDRPSVEEKEIRKKWINLVGQERIAYLTDANRVVDVIFGLLANETGRVDDFMEEIEERQKPEQVKTVYKSLATVTGGLLTPGQTKLAKKGDPTKIAGKKGAATMMAPSKSKLFKS